jgi:hypothetical protein
LSKRCHCETFEVTSAVEIDRVIGINIHGTLATSQAALKHMKCGGSGSRDLLGKSGIFVSGSSLTVDGGTNT